MKHHYLVTQILTYKGQSMTIQDYMTAAYNLVATELYPYQKAAGSLGGSIRSGFCRIDFANGTVTRVK